MPSISRGREVNQVYLVMRWDYSDTSIVGVFSDRAEAEGYCARLPDGNELTVEPLTLDELRQEVAGKPPIYQWYNAFQFHWRNWSMTEDRCLKALSAKPVFCQYKTDFCVYVQDRIGIDRARKIATEKAQQFKRLDAMGNPRGITIEMLNQGDEVLGRATFDFLEQATLPNIEVIKNFRVVCDQANNRPEDLAQGIVNVDVVLDAIVDRPPAE
jgi:hypothetical protein